MTVALADLKLAVNFMRQSVGFNLASPCAQTHGAAKFFDAAQLAQLVNHTMRRRLIELAGIGIFQPDHVARKLNAGRLHSETDPKVRNLVLAGVTNRDQHAFDAALAETAEHHVLGGAPAKTRGEPKPPPTPRGPAPFLCLRPRPPILAL